MMQFMPTKKPEYIYSNTEVDLGKIDIVGFDYDFTLVHYKPELQVLIYNTARDFLIEKLGYSGGLHCQENTMMVMMNISKCILLQHLLTSHSPDIP